MQEAMLNQKLQEYKLIINQQGLNGQQFIVQNEKMAEAILSLQRDIQELQRLQKSNQETI